MRILILLMAGLAVGCGGESPNSNTTKSPASSTHVKPADSASVGMTRRLGPAPDAKLTSSDQAALPFKEAGFVLNVIGTHGQLFELGLGGPLSAGKGRALALSWGLTLTMRRFDGDGTLRVVPPSDLDRGGAADPEPQTLRASLAKTSPGKTDPPAFWAVGGTVQITGFSKITKPDSMFSDHRYDAAFDLELRAVDRSGPAAVFRGEPFHLTGRVHVDTSRE